MIVKSIGHEQRQKAAVERAAMLARGEEPALKRVTAKTQAAHVIGASRYFMRPTIAGEKALGIEGHRVHRATDYLVGKKPGKVTGERLLHVAHQNFRTTTLAEQQAEMIALMTVEAGTEDAFEHLVLSPGHGVVPTRRQMEHVPARLLEMLSAADHQAFVVWHGDTDHVHGHIGVSRVDLGSGKRVQLGERWLLDSIGQAIAQIEYEQGWPSEHNALYRANERGVFRVKSGEQVRDAEWNRVGRQRTQAERRAQDEAVGKVRLSTGAAEFERHQRLCSDERAAQEIAWPIIRDAQGWDELHRELASQGFRYDKKGSGAQLRIGDRILTATTANWAASIAKLKPKLGEFEPRPDGMVVAPYSPRQLDGAEQHQMHTAAKKKAGTEKEAERAGIAQAANDAVAALTREHQRLQQLINETSWMERGAELELARKLVGAVHSDARDAIDENRSRADQAARELYRFPGFEVWLREGFLSDEDEEQTERRRRALPGIILGTNGRHHRPAVLLPNYVTEDDDLARRYLREGRVRFVDRGNRIDVVDTVDRTSVRDALLVAATKWGSVQISGDRRFRELAADIAAELDIEIANPELRKRIAREQARWRKTRKAKAESDDRLTARAEMLAAQWPLLRSSNGAVAISEPMRERYRVTVDDMLQPAFQAVLRRQVERQKPILVHMSKLLRTRPEQFRDHAGRVTLPDLDDPADIVRRQNWLRDAGFVRELETKVRRAEAARRQTTVIANPIGPVTAHAGASIAAGRERDAGAAPTATRGWNGITLDPVQRLHLLAAARARLAEQDWDPADYPSHSDPTHLAAERAAPGRNRSAGLPAPAGNVMPGTMVSTVNMRAGTRAAAASAQGRMR